MTPWALSLYLVLGQTLNLELTYAATKTLVLVDDMQIKLTHSTFFADLQARGHELYIKRADDPSLSLKQHGELIFHNLVIFSPSVEEFGGAIDVSSVLDFVDSGRNLLLAVTSDVGEPVREIAGESGVNFDTEGNTVIDHMSFDKSDLEGDHTLLVADDFNHMLLSKRMRAPVLFEGIAASLDPDNRLVSQVLSASSTAYSHNADKPLTDKVDISGSNGVLIAASQARNNARMLFCGSLKFFSDEFYHLPVTRYPLPADRLKDVRFDISGNRQAGMELTKWVFQERGLLRASRLKYRLKGQMETNPILRIGDDVEFDVEIHEWHSEGGSWQPFNATDVQLEFTMLDPHIRRNLIPNGQGRFGTYFKIPDVFGTFQFRVNYLRPGYSSLMIKQDVTVRPLRHDEYDRFLVAACPYYISSFSMLIGCFVFGVVLLYFKPPEGKKQDAKKM